MKRILQILFTFFFVIIFITINAQQRSKKELRELYTAVEDASEIEPGENIDEKIKKNFFLRAEVTKQNCFVGEPVMATFKAYSRLDANSQVVRRPSLSGFSVIEMVDAYNNQPDVEKYNGKYFYVHLIRKVQLFPLQAGDYILEPAEVESVIQMKKSDGPKDKLGLRDFFRREKKDPDLSRQLTFETPEVKIHVNPLPEKDQPENFSGAVGNFSLSVRLIDSSVVQHEPAVVDVIITGTGNFPLITDPEINWPKGVELSSPHVSENVNKYVHPLSGIKVFQYHLDHQDTGRFTIPPIQFSYFDPVSKKYKITESDSVSYNVKEGKRENFSTEKIIERNEDSRIHYYYFGAIALIITALIIYFAMRPGKNKP